MNLNNKINWFPGHMKKATDQIQEQLKNVDVIIEIVDARCIESSSNYELINQIQHKHHLKVALKKDLADVSEINNQNVLIGSIYDKNFRHVIINALRKMMEPKFIKYKAKGLVNPKFLVMVIGLPNVGKSSFINFLKKTNVLISQNYPGVTKKQRIVAIDQNFNLIDTPGIFLKNIENIEVAYKLGLIKSIKKEVLPLNEVLQFGYDYLKQHYQKSLFEYFQINKYSSFDDFLTQLANSKHYLLKHNEVDEQKIYDKLYNDLVNGLICKINYDK